ncbi:MAG: hypothetical protein EU541_03585 [Promethearchaeota archaeon]|nr:MAG: hypothetical protein EU541_03585 [Candidatus Lokiarchaeota archaeon]
MSDELARVKGIGPITAERFAKAGITTVEEIVSARPRELAQIKGIGITSAQNLIQNAQELLNAEKGIEEVLDSIKDEFIETCPKCGGEMKERHIILGPNNRVSVNQCSVCRFYLPK